MQQGFIYHALAQPNDDAYHVQLMWDYHHDLNIDLYKQAWSAAVATYPALRTSFNWDESLIQIIHKQGDLQYEFHDYSDQPDSITALKNLQQRDRDIRFDLSQPALLRIYVVKHADQHYSILKSEHHSVSDGWSGPLLLNQVHKYYADLKSGHRLSIIEDQAYYKAQAYYVQQQPEVEAYWAEHLPENPMVNDLNGLLSQRTDLDSVRSIIEPREADYCIDGAVYTALKSMVRDSGITMSVVLQFAWHKLLEIYTQDDCTIVGTTLSGRDLSISGIESSVGLYINTLPLCVDWSEDRDVLSQLKVIHASITGLNSHGSMNLAQLQHGGQRLFHSLLVFENYPASDDSSGCDLSAKFRGGVEKTDYPVNLLAYETNEGLNLRLKYAGEYITESQVSRLLAQLNRLLTALPNKLGDSHHNISVLDDAEYDKVIHKLNDTHQYFDTTLSVIDLFEQQAKARPDATALVYESERMSYQELDRRSTQLGHYIREQYATITGHDLQADTLVGLCVERGLDMVVGILGILKSGAAYVPIDPSYPSARKEYILEDTQAAIVVTQHSYTDEILETSSVQACICMDDESYHSAGTHPITHKVQPSDLAYVIYTSGTTGQPKGVMVEHQSVVNLIYNEIKFLELSENNNILQFSSISFDAAVFSIFSSLSVGACLFIATCSERKDPTKLEKLIIKNNINRATIPPAFMEILDKKIIDKIECIVIAGEKPSYNLINTWTGQQLINAYGPSEATVCSSYYKYKNYDIANNIGSALNNVKLYILNKNKIPQPVGAIGELYISGVGLSRGYLNKLNLTKKVFTENPFQKENDKDNRYSKIYKTGDIVRILSDGNIEYIGRKDDQVNIRGHRIEVQEISSILLLHPDIEASVTLTRKINKLDEIVSYLKTRRKVDIKSIRVFLKKYLPGFMIPYGFIKVDEFPLTINGKIDTTRLSELPIDYSNIDTIKPRSDIENKIYIIMQALLGIETISIDDDFFSIGGSSIKLIYLAMQLSNKFDKKISIGNLPKDITIRNLSSLFDIEYDIDPSWAHPSFAVRTKVPSLFYLLLYGRYGSTLKRDQ